MRVQLQQDILQEQTKGETAQQWHPAGIDGFQVSPLKVQILYAFHVGASCGELPAMAEKFSVSLPMLKDSLVDLLCGQFLLHSVSQHKATLALTMRGMAALQSVAQNKPEFIAMTDAIITAYSPPKEGYSPA